MHKGLIIGILLALVMVIFTLQNPGVLQVKFLLWKVSDVPVSLFMILSIALGAVISMIFYLAGKSNYKSRIKELNKTIDSLESELNDSRQKKEVMEMISEEGMSISGDPGSKLFDE